LKLLTRSQLLAGTGAAYEIGKGSPIASMLAHLRGLPLVVIANASMWDPKNPFPELVQPLIDVAAKYKNAG
jgi:hypothetical protein